jgi:hypothetical protein
MMAENDLVRLRPRDLAKVWGTAFGQIVDLWRTSLMALMELGSGEQAISVGQSARFTVPSANGQMPSLTARNMVGETYRKQLDGDLVNFTEISRDRTSVTVECSVDETQQQIEGDVYVGQVVDGNGTVVARISLDAGS